MPRSLTRQGNSGSSSRSRGDARNGEQSEVPLETGGFPNITLAVKDGFEPHGANRAVIDYIKKYYKKPIISYKEAPLKVNEVWFNEFKASERLSNALYDVHVEKSCPYWITLEVYKGFCELWNTPSYIAKCEKNKWSRNSSHGDDGPSSLHTCGSIPMSKHRRRLVAELENTKRLFMVAFKKILGINYPSIFQSDQEMVITGRHVNYANQSVGVDGDGTGVTTIDDGGMVLPRENE
nr:putative transposase En/Spm [Ipomoea batatas]